MEEYNPPSNTRTLIWLFILLFLILLMSSCMQVERIEVKSKSVTKEVEYATPSTGTEYYLLDGCLMAKWKCGDEWKYDTVDCVDGPYTSFTVLQGAAAEDNEEEEEKSDPKPKIKHKNPEERGF